MVNPTWVYHADIVNGAGGAGNHVYTVTVAARSQVEVLYGGVLNGDTSSRTVTVVVDDAANEITRLISISLNAGIREHFMGSRVGIAHGRILVSGGMRIVATVAAVALSQDSAFAIACLIREGGVPTVVEAGASTPTITINQEGIL